MAISNLTKSIDMSSQDFIISQKDKTFTPNEMGKTMLKINNFDPKKGENPFAYFTQIAFIAFFRRINTERKESYIKAKLVEGMLDDELYEMDNEHGELHNVIHDIRSSLYFDTADYEAQMEKKKKGKPSKLEVFMEAA